MQSIIGGLLVGIIGILLLVNPHGVWRATERWKMMNAAEASPHFLLAARAVGLILSGIGLLVTFGILK